MVGLAPPSLLGSGSRHCYGINITQNPMAQRYSCTMADCAKYESLLSEMISLGSDLTVARDQLAIISKKDARAYQSAQSRFKEAERKWKHARKELNAHKAEHGCVAR
jgi:hypothetical protein